MPDSIDPSKYQALDFPDSLRLLAFFDPSVRDQVKDSDGNEFSLHPWQVEVNEDISYGQYRTKAGEIVKRLKPTGKHPYKYALCAANGSGKDAFVIAPLALWFICTKIQSKVIITSSSGTQLTTQTEAYIRALGRNINAWMVNKVGYEILKINQRFIECTATGGVIHMFATDEGKKAEGHHPTTPISEMMVMVNEAKSVDKGIFEAVHRCTGYNYLVYVSSPGEPKGDFHDAFVNWPNSRRVSYFDCPHQSPSEFESDRIKYGEYSYYFRSKWLALFTYIGGSYIIDKEVLDTNRRMVQLKQEKKLLQSKEIRVGIDIALSGNGDESVISVWRGSIQIGQETFREQNAVRLSDKIEVALNKFVKKNHLYIYADDGGVGRAVIDVLNERGWKIMRVLNNSAAKGSKRAFRNRGAQLWYKVSKLFEKQLIFPLPDPTLYTQLASRKYKTTNAATSLDKLQLQSKREMIAEGINSPDRADALVLAFTDSSLDEFIEADSEGSIVQVEDKLRSMGASKSFDMLELKQIYRRGKVQELVEKNKLKRGNLSQACILKELQTENDLDQLQLYKFNRG